MRTVRDPLGILALLAAIAVTSSGCADTASSNGADSAGSDGVDSEEDAITKATVFSKLHVIGTFGGIELRSDVAVDAATAAGACSLTAHAYQFDRKLLGVDAVPTLARPFVIGLGSTPLMDGHFGAATLNANAFVAALRDYVPQPGLAAKYVVGHELTHMTMMRLGAPVTKVPVYITEGIATSIGWWFVRQDARAAGWHFFADQLAEVTGETAQKVVSTFRVPADYRAISVTEVGLDEHIGGLFIEYLRAHVRQDTHHAFGRMSNEVGAGATFEAAVETEYGRTLADLEGDFVAFMTATEGRPTERFAGTVWGE